MRSKDNDGEDQSGSTVLHLLLHLEQDWEDRRKGDNGQASVSSGVTTGNRGESIDPQSEESDDKDRRNTTKLAHRDWGTTGIWEIRELMTRLVDGNKGWI